MAHAEVTEVPDLVAGELVIGRVERVGFGIPLDLRDLDQRLPAGTSCGVILVERSSGKIERPEHQTAAHVAVVRYRESLPAGALLVVGEIGPERFGIQAVQRREGQHLPRALCAIGEHHDAVEVVAIGHGGPLVARKGAEAPGFVEAVGGGGDLVPHAAGVTVAADKVLVLGERGAPFHQDARGVSAVLEVSRPALARLGLHQFGIMGADTGQHAQILAVIGHHQKIQRPRQAHRHAVVRGDGLAAREAEGLLGADLRVAEGRGVSRDTGVEVGITPEQALGESAAGVG